MKAKMTLEIPDSLTKWSLELAQFLDLMIEKLDRNSHKNTPDESNLLDMIQFMGAEVTEFEEDVINGEFGDNAERELADVANFAFLAYVVLKGRK